MGARIERCARWLVKTVYRLATCCPRPVRFVMDHRIFASKTWGWLFRAMRAIPIASAKENGALKERAFGDLAAALAQGDLVCIFPEGRLSPTGELQSFQQGIERIVGETPVPVVPIALGSLWGSVFSRSKRSPFASWTRHIRRRVRAICGAPVAPDAVTCAVLEQRVLALGEGA